VSNEYQKAVRRRRLFVSSALQMEAVGLFTMLQDGSTVVKSFVKDILVAR
jgi:hypothetical protein